MRVKIELIIDLDNMDIDWDDEAEVLWFEKRVISKDGLVLHSNEFGDELGTIDDVKFNYINEHKLT